MGQGWGRRMFQSTTDTDLMWYSPISHHTWNIQVTGWTLSNMVYCSQISVCESVLRHHPLAAAFLTLSTVLGLSWVHSEFKDARQKIFCLTLVRLFRDWCCYSTLQLASDTKQADTNCENMVRSWMRRTRHCLRRPRIGVPTVFFFQTALESVCMNSLLDFE